MKCSRDYLLLMIEIETRAAVEGRSIESLLEEHAKRLRTSNYPTSECLLPDEIVGFADVEALSEERLKHADACDACATLLATIVNSDDAARDLVQYIRKADSVGNSETLYRYACTTTCKDMRTFGGADAAIVVVLSQCVPCGFQNVSFA